jgi:hypothetical protein
MSDPEPTQPVDVTETTEAPALDVDEGRQPWTVSQLRGRLKALDRTGRGGKQVAAQQVETLVGDAAFTVGWWERRYGNLSEEHDRLQTDYRALRTVEWEQRELIERHEHPESYSRRTPTNAIARVSGGRTHGEQIVARAEEHAARIVANAEEDARRIRATAQLETQEHTDVAEPLLSGDGPRDMLARIRWLATAKPALEQRVAVLRATTSATETRLADVIDETDRYAEVLPVALRALPGAIDVTEVDVTEAAQAS